MWSSPTLLSLSTVFALVGLALILVAGLTDNWLEYQVNRSLIYDAVNHNQKLGSQLRDSINRDPLYYSRTYGLLHVCFPESVPQGEAKMQRLWMMRGCIAAFLLGVALIIVCFLVGIVGCYRRSTRLTRATAFILFFASLFLGVSLTLWHIVYYQERKLLQIHPFYPSWDLFLKNATQLTFGWSYILFWLGLAFCLFAAIFLLFSGRAIQGLVSTAVSPKLCNVVLPNMVTPKYEEDRIYENKHAAYYQQQYYDKSLVPVSYAASAPYSGALPGAYGMFGASPAAYYGHPAYGSNYYGYLPYGA